MWLAPEHPGEGSGAGPRARRGVLSGYVVVVTGAGGAAGRAVVERLASRGAFVVAVDAEESRLAPLVETVLAAGGRCAGRAVDLVDEAATYSWASSLVDQCGHVDGLIHLVGGAGGMPDIEADSSDWDWMQALVVRTLQNASAALREQLQVSECGRLAVVSSLEAGRPTERNAYYAAAQAAAEAWVFAVADSFRGTHAAATVVSLRGLLSPAILRTRPMTNLPGFVDVDVLARCVEGLWSRSAEELNGARIRLERETTAPR
jgi:NADP-dependent 3-hydroxy acid dehydrogenase YdfG